MIAAIIIADSGAPSNGTTLCSRRTTAGNWACADVLGQPVVGRVANGLKRRGIGAVYVLATPHASLTADKAECQSQPDDWNAAVARLKKCKADAFDAVLVTDCDTYAEFDIADMLAFHHDQGVPVSRAYSADGTLDLWMINPSRFKESENMRSTLLGVPARYELNGYVNRLRDARDFRRLVLDTFRSRSCLRPIGDEIRPGVWVGENAEIGHNARIVPPAFIGRGVRIGDECLVTRGTNVERGSHVDFGTAVEDSSILPNTYLGIGLDLSHSVVDGRSLWNLRHDVVLDITDSAVMRSIEMTGRDERQSWSQIHDEGLSLSAQGNSR